MTPLMHGRKFLQALIEAGVISDSDHIRRVIIDAAIDQPVMLYVERFGDERLMAVGLELLKKDGGFVVRTVLYDDYGMEKKS